MRAPRTEAEQTRFQAWMAEDDALTNTDRLGSNNHHRWHTWRDSKGNKWTWRNTFTGGDGRWTVTARDGSMAVLEPEPDLLGPWTRIDWRGRDYVPPVVGMEQR